MFDSKKIKNQKVLEFIQSRIDLCKPADVVLIDGSEELYKSLTDEAIITCDPSTKKTGYPALNEGGKVSDLCHPFCIRHDFKSLTFGRQPLSSITSTEQS